MPEFHLAVETLFTSPDELSDDTFEAFLDEVLASFERIDFAISLSARLRDRVADFATVVDAPDFEDAVVQFLGALRTALHAAGCGTPRWPELHLTNRVVRELADA